MSMSKKLLTMALAVMITVGFMPFMGLENTSYANDAKVGVEKGATKIFEGMATDDEDITIYNDKIAASFAVGSNNYWNMTKGSILDIGIRGAAGTEVDFGVDLVNDVELLADLWTSTGTYKGVDLRDDVKVTSEVAEDGKSVSVTSEFRFWVQDPDKDKVEDDALPLNIKQVYTLKEGDSFITMDTVVENPAENTVAYADMYTGYSVSTNAAYMYGPFGFYPDVKTTGIAIGDDENVQSLFGKYVTTYKDDYAVSVLMDGADSYKGSTGYKDIYKHQDLEPGQSYEFKGEIVVAESNETASVMDRMADRMEIPEADMVKVEGTVTDKNGNPVKGASVIAQTKGTYMQTEKSVGYTAGHVAGNVVTNMQPLVWYTTGADGKYSFTLPKTGWDDGTANIDGNGDYKYQLKVEAAGYSSETTEELTVTENTVKDFQIADGAQVTLTAKDQKGNKIPIRVEVSGVTPEIKTAGVSVFFSDALNKADPYTVNINMTQANDVTFTASYGKDFESKEVSYTTDVTASGVTHEFVIEELVNPEEDGWYGMDNHQHSDFGDGATTIEDLYRAQVAAKLDLNVVSDHDARVNNYAMSQFAKEDGRNFISNLEISPGWGHWNMMGVNYSDKDEDKGSIVDATTATPQDIIKAAKENGAIVNLNHPYSDYGFLNNQDSVNGGHDEGWDGFNFLELQSTMDLKELYSLDKEKMDSIDMDSLNKTISAAGVNQMDAKSLVTAMKFWNEGVEKYITAGSDQHQATSTTLYPGIIRQYAKLDSLSTDNYLNALLKGNTYVTCGPLLFPDESNMFGETIKVTKGETVTLKFKACAVNGLGSVTLFGNGVPLETQTGYATGYNMETVEFEVTPKKGENTWYSIVAQDDKGRYAASNPIWIDVDKISYDEYDEAVAAAEKAKEEAEAAKAEAEKAKAEAEAAQKAAAESEAAKAEAEEKAAAAEAANTEAEKAKAAANKAHKKALKISSAKKAVKAKSLKKKAVKTSKVKVSGNMTTVTYKKVSGSKKLSIDKKTGKIKVAKKTKKGTYKIKVKVTTAADDIFTSISKTKTIVVKVK